MSQITNSITLKIHHGDEIRRFSIENLELNQVMELLHSNYSTPFILKYDDIDNDRVTIINQSDLDDALTCAHNYIVHLYVIDKSPVIVPVTTPATAPAPSASAVETKSDDLSSQLSSDEMKTILTECLSDPTIITTLPGFLMTFIDTLINNIQSTTPMQTSWNTALSAHPTIRDHVILSVLLPRVQQTLNKADISGMVTQIPIQTLQMIKGFIPMLPMFLPSLIPMLTQMMSSESSSDAAMTNPLAHLMSQTQGNTNPMGNNPLLNNNPMANNPLLSMLGPMFQQLQQSPLASMMNNNNTTASNTTTSSESTSTSTSTSTSASASSTDYSSQLSTLSDLGVGSPELNLSLLKQWNGDIEKVLEFLATMV